MLLSTHDLREAGAELNEGLPVESLLTDGDRVLGIRCAGSTPITAHLTVGADGKHSLVAQAVGAPEYQTVPTLMCWYFSYYHDVPDPHAEMYVLQQRRGIFAFGTNENLRGLCRLAYR